MTSVAARRVLLIDDDAAESARLAATLTAAGYAVMTFADALSGLLAIETQSPALIILAWTIPFISGETILFALRTGLDHPPPVIALIDAAHDLATVRAAGASAVLRRPPESTALLRTVEAVLAGKPPP